MRLSCHLKKIAKRTNEQNTKNCPCCQQPVLKPGASSSSAKSQFHGAECLNCSSHIVVDTAAICKGGEQARQLWPHLGSSVPWQDPGKCTDTEERAGPGAFKRLSLRVEASGAFGELYCNEPMLFAPSHLSNIISALSFLKQLPATFLPACWLNIQI